MAKQAETTPTLDPPHECNRGGQTQDARVCWFCYVSARLAELEEREDNDLVDWGDA